MVATRISRALLALGAVIGIAGVAALALDLRVNIPDWMIQVAMIKLALVASLGLLGAGAMLGRQARRRSALQQDEMRQVEPGIPDLRAPSKERETIRRDSDDADRPEHL